MSLQGLELLRPRPRAPLSDDPFEQWILSDTTETYGDWLANAPQREATQLREILQQRYAAPRFSLAMLLGGIAPLFTGGTDSTGPR